MWYCSTEYYGNPHTKKDRYEDGYRDGNCCDYGCGFDEVRNDGKLVAFSDEFGGTESTTFGTPYVTGGYVKLATLSYHVSTMRCNRLQFLFFVRIIFCRFNDPLKENVQISLETILPYQR